MGAWSPTWRLLAIAMPLTIASVALLGWGLGVAPAAALLLGAALAPTDPVLASDVQVEGPRVDGDERRRRPRTSPGDSTGDGVDDDDEALGEPVDEKDDVRFALTSEAGLNDGLAFPFVTAAMLLASAGSVSSWGLHWLAWDLVGKVVIGVARRRRRRLGPGQGRLPVAAPLAASRRAGRAPPRSRRPRHDLRR